MIKLCLYLPLIFISSLIYAQDAIHYSELELDSIFENNEATFVMYDLDKDSFQVYNYERALLKYPVHSTSKILWTIIGLEESLINETEIMKWDSIKYPPQKFWSIGWDQDQSVVSALHYSVNWYYFELLSQMTPEMIEQYLNRLDYQKGYHVEYIHYYGLTFTIQKSAFEQIDFLKDLYENKFGLSDKTLNCIKQGMTFDTGEGYRFYAKKGTGRIPNGNGLGWLIGSVMKDSKVWFFAFNVENKDEMLAGKLRNDYAMRVLRALDLRK